MEFIQRLVADIATVVEWEGRVLRDRVMRICWGAALALLSITLVLVTLLLVLAAVYLQIAATGGAVAGLLAASALALLCALGAGLAARGVSER
ncbi:MAG: hypothetical protein RLY21_2682 [Planctomycetota bacterium]|jgi:hypothetical protein